MADIITQLKNTAKDFIGDLLYEEWDKSFNKFAAKYKTLNEIPGFQQYVKNRPDLANQSTASWKSFFAGLAKGESSFRPKAKHGSYKGLYQIGNLDENRLSDYEYQHTEAFKHLGKQALSFLTKDDLALAHGKGYSQSDVLKMAWQQGRHVLNYLYTGTNPKDGNNTDFKSYLNKTTWDDISVNIYSSLPDADRTTTMKVDKTTRFFPVQDKKRLYGRNFVEAGADLYRGLRNTKGNIDSIKIKRLRGDNGYYLQLGETYDFNNRDITPPVSKKSYRLNTDFAVPQNQKEWETMMKDIDSIKLNIIPNMKKFGGKLRYGWGGVMSKDDLMKDMIYNSSKYNLTPANFSLSNSFDDAGEYGMSFNRNRIGIFGGLESYLFPNFFYKLGEGLGLIGGAITGEDDIYDVMDNWSSFAPDAAYDHGKNKRIIGSGWGDKTNVNLDSTAIDALKSYQMHNLATVENIKNRIENDSLLKSDLETKLVGKYGGLLKPRLNYGGYYQDTSNYIPNTNYNNMSYLHYIKPEDVSDSKSTYGVESLKKSVISKGIGSGASIGSSIGGIVGGIGSGIAAGAVAGAASTAWIPVIGPAAALIGAIIGAGVGYGVSEKNAEVEGAKLQQDNKYYIAKDMNLKKQSSMANILKRYDTDYNRVVNMQYDHTPNGFYSKYGGMIKPRIRYANGGTILPNSNNTVVAFGRTHEQMNPMTGETGITYGNAEIEGGGYVNGQELPGEVVRATPYGDEVFSDSIPIDDQGHTVADYAKMISDRKGVIEKIMNETRLNMERDIKNLNTSKAAKAKTGTLMRNIEKQAALFNKYTAESAKLDSDLEKLFAYQEQAASAMGLREGQPMRYGGSIRRTYDVGGWLSPVLSFGMNALTSGLQYWAADADAKYKQEILNGLTKRTLPKRAKEDPILLDPEYDITPEMNATEREASRIEKYIKDNVVNPKQARNLLSKVRLDKLEQQNKLRGIKKSEEKKVVDANIARIITNRNKMRVNQYENLLDQFNYDTNLAVQEMMINSQKTQATQQLLRDLGQSATQAAQMYMASKSWAPGVTKDMNGNVVGGNFKRMSDNDLKNHRYSLMFNSDVNATDFNALKHFNTNRYAKWYAEMLKRGFI